MSIEKWGLDVTLHSEGATRIAFFGVRQLAAALGAIDGLHRSEDESGSKLPHSKVYDFPSRDGIVSASFRWGRGCARIHEAGSLGGIGC
jgi:hypothetical protein